jgi:hypothetical protein
MTWQFWDGTFRNDWEKAFEKYVAKGAEEKD